MIIACSVLFRNICVKLWNICIILFCFWVVFTSFCFVLFLSIFQRLNELPDYTRKWMSFAFEHLKLRRNILVLCSALDSALHLIPFRKDHLEFMNTFLVRNGMAFMKYSRAGVMTPLRLFCGERGGERPGGFRIESQSNLPDPPPPRQAL